MIKKLLNDVGSKNALINKYLKKIAVQAGITKNVSFHISRHSFAKIAKDKRVDNNHLKNLLGHSDIKITEMYMGSFETEETDKVMNSIFEDKKQDDRDRIKEALGKLDPAELDKLFAEIKSDKSRGDSR